MPVRIELSRSTKRIRPEPGTWIRRPQIARIHGPPDPRELASLYDHRGALLGWGLYSPESDIALRVVGVGPRPPPCSWLEDRLAAAFSARARLDLGETTGYREVNSEGDGLPGLVVDRYADTRVVQITTAPMATLAPRVDAWLAAAGVDDRIVVRPAKAAAREGFEAGIVPSASRTLRWQENGLAMQAPGPPGQKTGAYHDQRDNRRRFARLARMAGGSMLDLGCHVGGFSLQAASLGVSCVAVDRSEKALAHLSANAHANSIASIRPVQADMFAPLVDPRLAGPFGSIVFDPPKVASQARDLARARAAATAVTAQLLGRVTIGGFLALCSCSHHLDGRFLDRIALDAGARQWTRIARWGAGPDHPVAPAHEEGEYLCVQVYQRRG